MCDVGGGDRHPASASILSSLKHALSGRPTSCGAQRDCRNNIIFVRYYYLVQQNKGRGSCKTHEGSTSVQPDKEAIANRQRKIIYPASHSPKSCKSHYTLFGIEP